MVQLGRFIEKVFLGQYVSIAIDCNAEQLYNKDELPTMLTEKINAHFERYRKVCDSDVQGFSDLDVHKQAACICSAILDFSPLRSRYKQDEEVELGFIYPNEALAAMCGFTHVQRLLSYEYSLRFSNNELARQVISEYGHQILNVAPQFPDSTSDHKGYLSNFFYLMAVDKQNSSCQSKSVNADLCNNRRQCTDISSCPFTASYHYLSYSKLFFHYELIIREKCRKNLLKTIESYII